MAAVAGTATPATRSLDKAGVSFRVHAYSTARARRTGRGRRGVRDRPGAGVQDAGHRCRRRADRGIVPVTPKLDLKALAAAAAGSGRRWPRSPPPSGPPATSRVASPRWVAQAAADRARRERRVETFSEHRSTAAAADGGVWRSSWRPPTWACTPVAKSRGGAGPSSACQITVGRGRAVRAAWAAGGVGGVRVRGRRARCGLSSPDPRGARTHRARFTHTSRSAREPQKGVSARGDVAQGGQGSARRAADGRSRRPRRGLQAVVAAQQHHLPAGRGLGAAERVALPLHDQHRHARRGQLGEAVLLRLARRVHGKGQAQHACRPRPPSRCGTPPAPPSCGHRTATAGDDPSCRAGATCSTTASHAVSSCAAGAGARRPATR